MIALHGRNDITSPAPVRRYQIGDIHITLASDLPDVLNDFAELYRGYPRDGAFPGDPIRMEVRQARPSVFGRRGYRIVADGEGIGPDRRRREVLPFLEWGINWRVIATRHDLLQVHAASMVYAGQGVVFAGISGCGKSTLVAGLMPRGWRYLSDEFALIDPNSLFLRPFPKAVCIKAGSFEIVKDLRLPLVGRRYYVKGLKGKVGYINPYEVGPTTVGGPAPIRAVIFPKYVPGGPPRIYPISRARAAFVLAGLTLNRGAFGAEAIAILSDVVRGAACYGLESGTIESTCALVESLFAAGGRAVKTA